MDLVAAVESWVQLALPEMAVSRFAQIDLDDLLHDNPALAVQTGIRCLEHAVAVARRSEDVDGMLTIPLDDSDALVQDAPALADALRMQWEYGPGRSVPGLYLLRPSIWRAFEDVEEYKLSLGTTDLPTGFVAYYRTWRSLADGWPEFNRCVYIRSIDRG